jgi:hypothetical protein
VPWPASEMSKLWLSISLRLETSQKFADL